MSTDFADLLRETVSGDIIQKLIPLLDEYQLVSLKILMCKAKGANSNAIAELTSIKLHIESEILYLFEGGKTTHN